VGFGGMCGSLLGFLGGVAYRVARITLAMPDNNQLGAAVIVLAFAGTQCTIRGLLDKYLVRTSAASISGSKRRPGLRSGCAIRVTSTTFLPALCDGFLPR
jgi:hypothetical protein